MEPERIKLLNDRPPDGAGRYVLYWMQAAQRAACNHCARACGRSWPTRAGCPWSSASG